MCAYKGAYGRQTTHCTCWKCRLPLSLAWGHSFGHVRPAQHRSAAEGRGLPSWAGNPTSAVQGRGHTEVSPPEGAGAPLRDFRLRQESGEAGSGAGGLWLQEQKRGRLVAGTRSICLPQSGHRGSAPNLPDAAAPSANAPGHLRPWHTCPLGQPHPAPVRGGGGIRVGARGPGRGQRGPICSQAGGRRSGEDGRASHPLIRQ